MFRGELLNFGGSIYTKTKGLAMYFPSILVAVLSPSKHERKTGAVLLAQSTCALVKQVAK